MKKILDDHLVKTDNSKKSKKSFLYFLLMALIIGSILSTIYAWYDVKEIIYTGPIMSAIGLIYIISAIGSELKRILFLGLIPILTSIIWFLIIMQLSLGPGHCVIIVPLSLSILTFTIIYFGLKISREEFD